MNSVPQVTYSEDMHTYDWPDEGLHAVLERFQESGDDIRAELTVTSSHPTMGGQLYFGRLLLMGPRSRADVRVALEKRDPEPDWGGMLEQVVTTSLRRYREGAPAVDLWADDLGDGGRYLVRPFLFDDAVNINYGSGDSGKSLFTLMLAITVASGAEVAGLVPERSGPVLYCDWEDSPTTHQERLKGLCSSLGIYLAPGQMIYRRMDASLTESAREVRKDIARFGAALVVIDSLGMACGGDPSDAAGIIRAMLAARSLGVPVVAIHHIGKDVKDKSTPYGSVYASNEARMSWLIESERTGSRLDMVLTNHKANRGARHERQSYRFEFQEDDHERIQTIAVSSTAFAASRGVGESGHRWRIADFLNVPHTLDEISEALGMTRATARTVLNRYKDMFVKGPDDRWGRLETRVTEERNEGVTGDNSVMSRNVTGGGSIEPRVTGDMTEEAEGGDAPW